MLLREEELRLAPSTQRAYEAAEAGIGRSGAGAGDWLEVTDALQRRVVREFIWAEDKGRVCGSAQQRDYNIEESKRTVTLSCHGGAREELLLRALRSATSWYPALCSIPLYVRHNRARAGELKVGDRLPDAALRLIDGTATSLVAHLDQRDGIDKGNSGVPILSTTAPTLLVAGSIS